MRDNEGGREAHVVTEKKEVGDQRSVWFASIHDVHDGLLHGHCHGPGFFTSKLFLTSPDIQWYLIVITSGISCYPQNMGCYWPSVSIVYLTSPEPLKNCHNFFILHPILKTLPPLESTHLSRSDDILYYT